LLNMLFTTLIASAALIAGSVARGGPAAKTTHGEVVGKVLNGKVKAWLGVPFAQSPPERFSPPKEPKKWKNPRETTKLPAACIQQFNCEYSGSLHSFGSKVETVTETVKFRSCRGS